tara:strand:- start:41 stop:631 length:591 start_codon:yes stop_codon:yes gene_type:complete
MNLNLPYNFYYMTRMLKDKLVNRIYDTYSIENYVVNRMDDINVGFFGSIYNLTYDSTFIIDNIYLGNAYNASNWINLKNNNIGLIINITKEIPNYYINDIEYYNIYIKDTNDSDILSHLDKFIEKVELYNSKSEKQNILIHCYMGSSRSASLVVGYLCKQKKMNVDDAIKFVKNKRNLVNINTKFFNDLKIWNNEA